MNLTETKQLLAVIAARYPNSKVWDQEPELTIKAWQMTLDDVALGDAQRVLVSWFKSQKWAPDPSEIRGLLAEAVVPVESEGEAWKDGIAWVRNGGLLEPDQPPPFGVRVMKTISANRRDLRMMELDDLKRDFGYRYREMVKGERTERTAAVGELAAAGGLRAIS